MTSTSITNSADIIDSRDVVERLDDLESQHDPDQCGNDLATCIDSDEHQELATLKALLDECEGYTGDSAKHGFTLIRDSYFEDYAQEFAEDIGAINRDAKWPNDCIDWERAARELQMDYTSVEFDGISYWVR